MSPPPPTPTSGVSRAASRAIVTALFLVVPLATLPTLGDPYVIPKWHVLDALVLLLVLVEVTLAWDRPPAPWGWLAAAGGLCLVSVVRLAPFGKDWISPVLLDRSVALVLPFLLWRALCRGDLVPPLRRGLVVSVALTASVVLLQSLGLDPLWLTGGGDHRSAAFGNVNLAAEFLGLAAVGLLTLGVSRALLSRATEVVLAVSFAALLILGSRSVLLGLGVAAVVLAWRRDVPPRVLARMGLGGALLASTLLFIAPYTRGADLERILPETGHPLTASGRAHKQASLALRLGAWRGSLLLMADRPWGLGAGRFEHAFIPYQLATTPTPNEAFWFRSPHNELLRLGIEEGLPVAAVLLVLLFFLLRRLRLARGAARNLPFVLAGGTLLLAQCTFQFPLETACGVLFASLWLALLVDAATPTEASITTRVGFWPRRLLALGACGAVAAGALALHRSARANALLGGSRGESGKTTEACSLEPRNLAACVTAAWLLSADGEQAKAQALTLLILERSPHYYPAIKLLGELRLAQGQREAGCGDLALYERLFQGRGLASRLVDRYCRADARPRARVRAPSLFWSTYPGL